MIDSINLQARNRKEKNLVYSILIGCVCHYTSCSAQRDNNLCEREGKKNAILKWNKAFAEGHKSFKVKKLLR